MATSPLLSIDNIVVLMLENRSFDHMLGFLYAANGNVSPTGAPFDGLIGNESNPDSSGNSVPVRQIQASDENAYYMPGADPGEGYSATNSQLFGAITAPSPANATNQGFVTDYSYTLGWEANENWSIIPGTTANDIMNVFTPAMLPMLSGLATGFAVCDQWFCSVPTETLPNRAFVCAATSQGHMDDKAKKYTCPSIFGALSNANVSWSIYGYSEPPLTRQDFSDTVNADDSHLGLFTDFQAAAANGTLASYVFLEPSWDAAGNSCRSRGGDRHHRPVAPAAGSRRIGFAVAGSRRERRRSSHDAADEDEPGVQRVHPVAHRGVEGGEAFIRIWLEFPVRWDIYFSFVLSRFARRYPARMICSLATRLALDR